jgi:Ran GTPase-activating protein (RanGAP) involved in mRNA processing and transport
MSESWKSLKLPLSPTRRATPHQIFSLTGRVTFGTLGNRVQTPSPRCPTPTGSRPGTAYSSSPAQVFGITSQDLKSIFSSKCKDLKIPENANQELRFFKYCEKSIKNRSFTIQDQGLGPISAKVIGQLLQNSSEFCRLSLPSNKIQDQGCLELSQLISTNSGIIHVDISSNDLSGESLRAFFDLFISSDFLVSLDISTYNSLSRNRLNAAASESLSLLLSNSKVLIFLELNDTNLGDSGLERLTLGLKMNKSLLKLGLAGNNLTHKSLVEFCAVIGDTCLEDLNLSSNKLADAGCRPLADLLVYNDFSCALKRLDISRNDVTYKGINGVFLAIRYNPNLAVLNCESNPLGHQAGQSLHFSLLNNYSLTHLNLNSCMLKNEGISHLSPGLISNKSLKVLNLSNNEIKDLGIKDFCEAIAQNEILSSIDLSFNHIRDGSILAEMLKKNVSLENLNLKENKIKEHFGSLFVEASRIKTNLIKMNLEGNHLNMKHLEEIKQNMRRNETLYYRGKSPTILKKIERLQSSHKDSKVIHDEISKKSREKTKVLNRVHKLRLQLNELKANPDKKLEELKNLALQLKQTSYLLSVDLDSLEKEKLKFRLLDEKASRDHIDNIGRVVADTKHLEKISNFYLEIQKKEEFALKRSTLTLVITQLKSLLESEEVRRRSAHATLSALNIRMLSVHDQLNILKYSEDYYKERAFFSPQPTLRTARRFQSVRRERSPHLPPRRALFYSPN